MEFKHVSVLLDETIENILTDPDGIYIDCTLGGAGHSMALGQRLTAKAILIGLDQDGDALKVASDRLQSLPCQVITVQKNFRFLGAVLDELGIEKVTGILFDLGVSSYQLDNGERGFSYQQDGPLDMRMDQRQKLSAYVVVNSYSEEELYRIIREYGEEKWAKRIAAFIVAERKIKPVETTEELVRVIKKAVPAGARRDGPHPAKRTFQAIRIAVNQELTILEETFTTAADRLAPGGRLCIITFHSLEDRIAKQTIRRLATNCICSPDLPVCRCDHHATVKGRNKPIEPGSAELEMNPRSRSARLRVAEKL